MTATNKAKPKKIEENRGTVRIVCLSDTHGLHRQVKVPDGDILIHAGDLTNIFQPFDRSVEVLKDINAWLGELPHRHKVVVAGNHDLIFQKQPMQARELLNKALYLENASLEIEGIRFWGSPFTPVVESMAFATPDGVSSRMIWNRVPNATDVLITHGPPYGTGDQNEPWEEHRGCLNLLQAVMRVRPRLHIFGHIHGGYGKQASRDGTWFLNCSVVNAKRQIANAPIVVDLRMA